MLRLYTYFRSSSAYRVRIALNLKGLEHELVPVHLVKDGGQQRTPAYLDKNPMGQIPLLEHDDFQLTQSLPIIEYIESLASEPPLISEDTKLRCQQYELCEIINSGIQPIQNLNVLQYLKSEYQADKDRIQSWCKHWIDNGFQALEKRLRKTSGKFSFYDEPSIVDCFLIPQAFNARRWGVDMNQFPTIAGIEKVCLEIEAFKKAHPEAQADAE